MEYSIGALKLILLVLVPGTIVSIIFIKVLDILHRVWYNLRVKGGK